MLIPFETQNCNKKGKSYGELLIFQVSMSALCFEHKQKPANFGMLSQRPGRFAKPNIWHA